MEDVVKNFVYTGVSVFAYATDKVRETVESLMNEEKISSEEGQRIVDEFIQSTASKKDEFEAQLKMLSEKVVEQIKPAASGGSNLDDLEARVEALEAKAPAKKTTVKKTATSAE